MPENEAAGRHRLGKLQSLTEIAGADGSRKADAYHAPLRPEGETRTDGLAEAAGETRLALGATERSEAKRDAVSAEAYDVSDVLAGLRDFPGPSLDLKAVRDGTVQPEKEEDLEASKALGFQELMRAGLGGADNLEVRIENKKLVVKAPPETQEKVKQLLEQLRQAPGATAATESRSHAFDDRFLKELGADPSVAEGRLRAYYWARRLDRRLTPQEFKAHWFEVPPPVVGDEGLGEQGFRKRYGVHPFVDTSRDHLSTFGMDVDTASYTLARNLLRSGKLPEPKQVRVEEFVNYFREEVPTDPELVFSVACEGGPAPFGAGLDLLKITVKARELRANEVKPAVLTFAVDTSGSMNLEDRLGLVRGALKTLVASLKPEDRVGIVAYDAHAYLVLPHTAAREGRRILGAIDSLAPGGGTNVEAGLELAYRVADEVFEPRAVNRVILASDGVANVGARGPDEILKKVQVFARRGIYLSAVGFGMGRYNDALLETLANQGNGNYAYVDGLA
ncbi:MAG: vWA domain-containing protein, partial [Thermoanaerobaculia bacterium]